MLEVDRLSIRFKMSWDKSRTLSSTLARRVKAILRGQRTEYFDALKDVSFEAHQGDIVGVIGPNGSGKSTLLRAISGIYQPDGGAVYCQGSVSSLLSLGTGFDLTLNGIDNIYLNGMLVGMTPKQIDTRLDEIIEFAELRDHMYKPMKYYSNGMISRLGFAMILALEPEILLIDEIFSVGDIAFQRKSERVMHELLQKTACQMIVTHDLQLVREHCNRAVYIRAGQVAADGLPEEVLAQYEKDFA
jgi:ABC-type polysaccharide/polyol phosphate transport system ATPase subunit